MINTHKALSIMAGKKSKHWSANDYSEIHTSSLSYFIHYFFLHGRRKAERYFMHSHLVFSPAIKVFAQRPYNSVTFNRSFKDLQVNVLSFQKGGACFSSHRTDHAIVMTCLQNLVPNCLHTSFGLLFLYFLLWYSSCLLLTFSGLIVKRSLHW